MSTQKNTNTAPQSQERRDFVTLAATSMFGIGACAVAWPLIDSMNPSQDVLALASKEVNISDIEAGSGKKVLWRGKPVFIYRRTPEQVQTAKNVPLADLPDPQTDEQRTKPGKEEWLVMIGVCTHLGCVPIAGQGEYNGWFCPCHGSHYDISGRIRKGPAATNMAIPPYKFLNDNTILIG